MEGLMALPGNCLHEILSMTSPRDVCRLSAVSKGLKMIADSDVLWREFLPSDYGEIVSRASSLVVCSSLKKLYLRLSNSPILLDAANMSFALDKESGKKCFMVGARNLIITWVDTPRYWRWISLPQSRFSVVAKLVEVCWLEIKGRMETRLLSPNTTYTAYLVYNIARRNSGLDSLPMKGLVKFAGERGDGAQTEPNTLYLKLRESEPAFAQIPLNGSKPHKREDGWLEVELGEFFNGQEMEGEVEMQFWGWNHPNWKSGLIVEGIELRPKADSQVN